MAQPNSRYLSMEYGPAQNLPCNVHQSAGTMAAMQPHYHDFYQIYFLLEGSLIHQTEQREVTLCRGDCFIVPPFFSHRIARGAVMPRFYSFSFRPEFLPPALQENEAVQALFAALTPRTLLPKLSPDPASLRRLEELMGFALQEFEAKAPGWDCALQGLLAAILVLLSRAYTPQESDSAAFQSCLSYLSAHFREDVTLPDLIGRSYLSPASFTRTFRAVTGSSFKAYLTARRIDYACALLRQTEKSVAAIAAESGYRDFSTFSRAFLKTVGTTPLHYRKTAKRDPP